jgi:hypothetical protein
MYRSPTLRVQVELPPAQQAIAAVGARVVLFRNVVVSAAVQIPFAVAGSFVWGGGGVDWSAPQLNGKSLGSEREEGSGGGFHV